MRITKKNCRFLKMLVLNKVELEGKAVVASMRPLATEPQLLLFFALEKANFINVFYVDLKFSSAAENGLSPYVIRTWGVCVFVKIYWFGQYFPISPSHNSSKVVIFVFHLCCPNLVSSQNQLKEFHCWFLPC